MPHLQAGVNSFAGRFVQALHRHSNEPACTSWTLPTRLGPCRKQGGAPYSLRMSSDKAVPRWRMNTARGRASTHGPALSSGLLPVNPPFRLRISVAAALPDPRFKVAWQLHLPTPI